MLNADRSEGAAENPRRRSLSSSSNITRPLLLYVRRIPSLLQSSRFFTANTQGSAKPPPRLRKAYVAATRRGMCVLKPTRARRSLRRRPGLSSCTPSAFSTFPCSCRCQPAFRYLMYFSPITLVAAMPRCVPLRLLFVPGGDPPIFALFVAWPF